MTYAARIANRVVVEIAAIPEGLSLAEMFHPDAGFVPCDNTVTLGMSYDGARFGAAPAPAPLSTEELQRRASQTCRQKIEAKVSETTQRNLTAYVVDLVEQRASGATFSADQAADIATARAIRLWIEAMLVSCRALIAASDPSFADVSHWPAWNDAWSALVARF